MTRARYEFRRPCRHRTVGSLSEPVPSHSSSTRGSRKSYPGTQELPVLSTPVHHKEHSDMLVLKVLLTDDIVMNVERTKYIVQSIQSM